MNKNTRNLLFLCEIIVANIIIYGVFYRYSSNPESYFTLNPNPLVFVVGAMGLLYGSYLGVGASIITIIFYLMAYFSSGGSLEEFTYYFDNYKYPLIFLWIGLTTGIVRDLFDRRNQALVLNREEILEKNYLESKENRRLRDIEKNLRQQIEDNKNSIIYLTDISKRMENTDSEEVFNELALLISKYLNAKKLRVYMYNAEKKVFRLKVNFGEYEGLVRSFFMEKMPKLIEMLDSKKAEKIPGDDSIMSMFLRVNDKPISYISIDEMAFNEVSQYNFKLFEELVGFAGRALERNNKLNNIDEYTEATDILDLEEFQVRFNMVKKRKELFKMDYAMIRCTLKGITIDEVRGKLNRLVRETDFVTYLEDEKELKFIFPATPVKILPKIEARMREILEDKIEILE